MSINYKKILTFFFFFITLAVGIATFQNYGISWDEPRQREIGAVTVKYVAEKIAPSLVGEQIKQFPELEGFQDSDYGVAFEAPAFAIERALSLQDSRTIFLFRHLLNFLVFMLGVISIYFLAARRYANWRFGLLAAAFLIFSPRIFSEAFYNSKDIVFMSMFVIAMNSMIVFLLNPRLKTAIVHAFATALAIDIRLMAVIIPVITVVVLLARKPKNAPRRQITNAELTVYVIATCALVVAMWPWLWNNPLGKFIEAFQNMSRFRSTGGVLFLGEYVSSRKLPWNYVIVWISITTPIMYLGLFLIGMLANLKKGVVLRMAMFANNEDAQDMIFLGLFFAPLFAIIVMHSVLYDAWRQMYFIYPPLLLVSIKGWDVLWQACKLRPTKKALAAITLSVSFLYVGVWMSRFQPMGNVYFNFLAGHNLRNRFDLDYWGLANKDALQYIAANDSSQEIHVRADSVTPLQTSFLMLHAKDRIRLRESNEKNAPLYVLNNYRGDRRKDDAFYLKGYRLFYQLKVDDEIIVSVYKWIG